MLTKAVLFAPGDRHESPTPSPHALKTPSQPLAMLPVGNQPLVRHALDELATAGVTDVTVVSEPDIAEEVEQVLGEWPAGRCETAHVTVPNDSGFLGALHAVADHVADEPFLVHLGDSLRHDGLASAVAPAAGGPRDVLALVQSPASEVTPVGAGLASLCSAGIYVFGPSVLDLTESEDRAVGWDLQIAAAADELAEDGGSIELRPVRQWWRYRQRPDVLLQANRYYLSGLELRPTEAWLENTDLQGPVSIDPSARIRSSTVRGPVIIGAEAEISDAYIGPYSSIGHGVVIENAEVEHSIILPGASIKHLGGRLEASVIGSGRSRLP
jgi:glucose-1-phosphate thymidylyltransferase